MSTTEDPAFEGLQRWPEDLVSRYRDEGIWGEQNLAQWVNACFSHYDDNNTVLSGPGFPDRQWQALSRQEVLSLVRRLAKGLQSLGLQPGDRVVTQLANNNAFVITLLALFELGVIPVMALPGHRLREIEHFLCLTGAKAWLASDDDNNLDIHELAKSVRDAVPELKHIILDCDQAAPYVSLASLLDSGDMSESAEVPSSPLAGHFVDPAGVALLLCSGGTTGVPKLIPRTHRDYIYNAKASAEVCNIGTEDRYLVALPAAHNFPLACPGILGALSAGAGIVMCPSPSPDIAFDYISRSGASITSLVPPLVKVWLDATEFQHRPPESLRLLQVGGAKLAPSMARRVPKELGCALQQVFGMAEGLLNFTRSTDPSMLAYNTQGRPLSEYDDIRVVDTNGTDVEPGKSGELWTRGPYTLRGYYKDDPANQRSFSEDGYYQSGDLVRQLRSGHLVVEGRVREVIRRGAETVSAESLEVILVKHASIQDVAIIGLPNEHLGEAICAAIVLIEPATQQPTLADIRRFLTEQSIARHMLPDSLEVIDQLPLTAVGKIARQQLVKYILARHDSAHLKPAESS